MNIKDNKSKLSSLEMPAVNYFMIAAPNGRKLPMAAPANN
jgi:hypothetical protein